jgi:hypothetical protein
METLWEFITQYWHYVASVLGAFLAILSFAKNLLIIKKLNLEIKKLKSENSSKDDEGYKLIQKATNEEIEKYSKKFPRKVHRVYSWSGRRYSIFRGLPPSEVTEPGSITQPIKYAIYFLIFYYLLGLYESDSWFFDLPAFIAHGVFVYCLLILCLDEFCLKEKLSDLSIELKG